MCLETDSPSRFFSLPSSSPTNLLLVRSCWGVYAALCSPGGGHIVPLLFSGMKAGLKRTFSGVTQDHLEVSDLPQWRPLLFTVAFLHTTVQVRPNEHTVCSETHQTPFINASIPNIDVHLRITFLLSSVRSVVSSGRWAGTSRTSSTRRTSHPVCSLCRITWTSWTPRRESTGAACATCWVGVLCHGSKVMGAFVLTSKPFKPNRTWMSCLRWRGRSGGS